MEVFRLVREKYALPLTGKGAALKGGRWNSAGVELIYTAQNRSLAMAEVAVHLTLATLPSDFVMLTLTIPSGLRAQKLMETDLPENWKKFPPSGATQEIGDEFVRSNKHCLLYAPSAIVQGDYNVLINPRHKDFSRILVKELVRFPFNERMVR